MDLTISKIMKEDYALVDGFIRENFWPEMPLVVAFGLQDEYNSRGPQPPPNAADFSLKAVDTKGETVGMAIIKVKPVFATNPNASEKAKKLGELLNHCEEQAGITKLPGKTIELRILAIRPDWRQRGVGRRLTEESMRLAREAGFTTMIACCTSAFTARLMRSLGWREHYRMAYKDYSAMTGRQVHMNVTPPHEHLCYYLVDL